VFHITTGRQTWCFILRRGDKRGVSYYGGATNVVFHITTGWQTWCFILRRSDKPGVSYYGGATNVVFHITTEQQTWCFILRRDDKRGVSYYDAFFKAHSQNFEKPLLASSCLSVRLSAWNTSAPTGRSFIKFNICGFYFWKSIQKNKFHLNRTRITGTLHEDQHTFSIISRSLLLRMNDISEKSGGENRTTHFMFNNFFFYENRAVYEIMWKTVVQRGRSQMKWRMRIACRIPKVTNAHKVCEIPISFPPQQWLHERASLLMLNVHCLFVVHNIINNVFIINTNDQRKQNTYVLPARYRLCPQLKSFSNQSAC
jgi:hypothetical protein